jgi:predicted nucleic acid-binding protein
VSDVFLDTAGILAVWDVSDLRHGAANLVYTDLMRHHRRLVTTPEVLLECGNAAARRPYRSRVPALRQSLRNAGLLVEPTQPEIDEAWTAYDRGDGAQAGIVDQISFIVMRRLGIVDAFTNDRHFEAAGFRVMF